MGDLLMYIFMFGPAVASVIAAVYAYKAYELVKLERDIRIAREEGEKNENTDGSCL